MKIIARRQKDGKTTEAVEWVKEENDRYLVVTTEYEKRRVANEFDLSLYKIFTWTDLWRGKIPKEKEMFFMLDNADHFLESFLCHREHRLGGITYTVYED